MAQRLTVLVLAAAFFAACGGSQPAAPAAPASAPAAAAGAVPEKAVCPVAKREFSPSAQTATSVHEGKTYYFCCPGCKPRFDADPASFVQGAQGEKKACTHCGQTPCKCEHHQM